MKISVVIPTCNSRQYIDSALQSIVRSISYVDEILIIDKLSVDGTIQYLQDLNLPCLSIFSQDDSGPAQALNAGFLRAKGDIIGWLNSDDYYSVGAIERAFAAFNDNPQLKIIYGHGSHVNFAGEYLGAYPTLPPTAGVESFFNGSFICQPTVFFRKEVISEIGMLDEALKTAFDMDFWLRVFLHYGRNQIGFIDEVQAYSRLHDHSITRKFRQTVALESMQLLAKYLDHAPRHWILTYFNELCEFFPFVSEHESLSQILENVLIKSESFMLKREFAQLSNLFNADFRLRLSSSQFFVATHSDGWVSNSFLVRSRFLSGEEKFIRLQCAGNWPFDSELNIAIYSPGGDVENFIYRSREKFVIDLRIPKGSVKSFLTWKVLIPEFFVPAALDPSSRDFRKLSFRVNAAYII
jgi:glycosyltransferase involved in cell wall biosynthesis